MEFCKVTLTFESVDEILWCDHSNESSLPVLTHGAICFPKFHKMKFGNLVQICFRLNLAVKSSVLTGVFGNLTLLSFHYTSSELFSDLPLLPPHVAEDTNIKFSWLYVRSKHLKEIHTKLALVNSVETINNIIFRPITCCKYLYAEGFEHALAL